MEQINDCKAAFAQANITPDFPVELIGCYREDNTASGVLHNLYAQVVVLERSNQRYCIIAIDSLGLTTALSDTLRSLVAEQLETSASCVMLNFSHTHSAPAPLSPLNGELYFQFLCSQVKDCVKDAVAALQPCIAGWSVTETDIAENRREGCTLVDKRLGALKIAHAEHQTPLALILRVSAHANILMRENNRISSDYFGVARDKIAEYFGCSVMIIQGAAGNLKPIGVDKISGGNLADVDYIADVLLQSAKQLRFELIEIERLTMYTREVNFYSDVPAEEEAKRIADDGQTLFGIDGASWLEECRQLWKGNIVCQVQRESIQFFFLNNGCLCGLPDEIFCELSLEAVHKTHAPLLLLNGYTNGCTGYLPHNEEWRKGGYETLYSYLSYYAFHGHVMPFRQDTAQHIIELVVDEWKKEHGLEV